MKIGTVGVNAANIEAYRNALKGLSVEQSVFALASKGATEEQIRQILVTNQAMSADVEAALAKASLTTTTKALNAEEMIALATKKGIATERAKEIASALGLIATEEGQIISKKQLTVATLQQAGATNAEITAILGLNAAETANIGITNVLAASFAKLWAVITAHPIGAILTAIGVVAVSAVTAYNKWGDTLENTKEKLSDLKSECQEIVSDLQAVNSELETTQQRLEELEGKDTLTFTEKEEYDNLVKINNELQRKIDLLELEEKNKRKEQNKTFVSAMEKDTEDPFEHEVNPDGKKPAGQYSISDEYLTSETGYIEAQFEIRDQLLEDLANAETEKEKERIQKRIDEIDKYLNDKNDEWKNVSDGIDYIENPTTEDDKAVNEWLDYIADFQDRMAIAISKDNASSNAQYKTNTFNRVVDNWQFDETVQGLQDLGKEGKVTAEMLDDPKYDDFINKLVFLGVIDSADNLEDVALAFNSVATSAENAADSASRYADASDIFSGFSEDQSKAIDEYKDKISSIKSYLEKVDDVSFQSGDFTELIKDFPEVENMLGKVADGSMTLEDVLISLSDDALQKLYDTIGDGLPQNVKNDLEALKREAIDVGEATKGLKQAFSDIQKVYDVKNEFKDALNTNSLTDSILSSVAGIDEEMNHLVALFYAGLVSADELYDALEQHYDIDLKNYGNAIIAKNQYSEEFYNNVWLSNDNFVNSFAETYKVDLSNCKTYHQAKAKITAETIQKLGSMWAQYYDAQAMAYTAEYSSLVESAQNGNAQAGMLVGQIHAAVSQYQNAINALNNISYQGLDDNFQSISGGLSNNSSSSSGSNNNDDEIYDWIEVRIKRLQEAYDKLNKKATDTFKSLTKRQREYENMLSNLGSQRETYIQGINKYEEKLNSIGLSEDWAEKVRNGSIDISTVSDESLKEKIKQYQEWYEKLKNCRDELEDIDSKINEIKITKIQIEIDIDQKKLDKLEAKLDKLQFRLDLSQLFGGLGSASVYNAMNDNIQNQIANLRQQNELMAEQASLVERGSEAWWEYQNSINSNNSSINSLLQTIAQNAQSIANLRNDRADRRVEELDNLDELTSLRMQNSSGNYRRQNRYVSEENANIERRQREYAQAVANNKESLKNSRSEINKIKSNKENKDILKEVKKYTKAKKQIPTSLLEKASKLNDNGVLYTALVNYNAALAALETSQQSADLYDQQSVQDKIDLVRQRMSNIEAYYGNRQGMLDQRATRVNNAMNLAEAQGHATSTAYYKQLRSLESKKRNSLIAERDALQKELEDGMRNGTIRQYSDEWYELVQRIDDVTNAIDESSIALQNYDNQMRQIKWDRFDELQEKIRGISEELNFLINELSRKKLSDEDTGWMTEEGVAVATLRLGNYRQYLTLRDDLLKEINSIDKQIEKNPADTTLIARKEELYQRYRDVIQSAQDEKYAIIELYKQGYDALISRIESLISEYTDLLDAEKDAYDYQQKIADATKNIATLRKQLIAYSGDISEETRSKIQKITVELEDAEKNLRETQNERMISEQKKMLSEFQDDLQENIQDIIDNLDDNFEKIIKELKDSTSAMETVRDTVGDIGYQVSDNIDNILNGDNIWKDTKTEIVSIKEQQAELIRIAESIASSVNTDGANNEVGKTVFENDRRSANFALREAESKYKSYNIEGVKAGLAKASEDYSVAGIKYSEQQKIVHESNIRYMNALKKYGSDDPETIRLRKEFESNLDTLNKYKKERDEALSRIKESELQLAEYKRLEKQYNDAKQAKLVMDFLNTRLTTTASSRNGLNDINKVFYDNYGQRVISDSEIEELAKLLGLKKLNGTNSSSELYKKLKSIGIPGFKIGSRNILEKQIALLGENGMELQFRKAQGTLGVVGQGDKIFTNEQAENLWKISKMNISDFIPNFTTNIPSFAGSHVGNKNINISIGDIILPDVTNTEQFASALKDVVKNNTSVQRLLKDSTIGTLSRNNNSLSIRKY